MDTGCFLDSFPNSVPHVSDAADATEERYKYIKVGSFQKKSNMQIIRAMPPLAYTCAISRPVPLDL